jgi:rhodanese-related sulfurtransferase
MVENISPRQTWDALCSDARAKLVDVRTVPEWDNIGIPDLATAGKAPALVSWQTAPAMQVNARFIEEMKQAGVTPEDHIYFLCRSGARSLAAANAAQAAGFAHVYNIADGFEGPPDASGQRGHVAGWQADELPWERR